jgi:hypothetical protein
MSSAVERFRARFAGLEPPEGLDTPEARFRAALDLYEFNLRLSIDQVANELGVADEAKVLEEVNRRRLASSPMPRPLGARVAEGDGNARPR